MMNLAMIEPMAIQMSFDYSEYSPELAVSLEQHAANMEGFTKRYAAGMGKELAEAKAEIHAEKQTGWTKWVVGRLGITVSWADIIIKRYNDAKSPTKLGISPPEPIASEPEIFQPLYDHSKPAHCKYCYQTHDDWELSGDHDGTVWICQFCDHATRDDFMQIVDRNEEVDEDEKTYTPRSYAPQERVYVPPVVSRGVPPALQMSESNEWYTPEEYIDAARELMGGIELDPASCAFANKTVKAADYYDISRNGLREDWKERVWLNPPYGFTDGKSNQDVWTNKLLGEIAKGHTKEAVLLVNANTEAKWFQPLYKYPICFTDHRIRFNNSQGESSQPTQGNALIYFGPEHKHKQFKKLFSKFGFIGTFEKVQADE